MGKLVQGFRPGVLIQTAAGPFRNGSEPTKEIAAALKDLGFKLDKTGETLEPAVQTQSTMRSQQIQQDMAQRESADIRADEIGARAAVEMAHSAAENANDVAGD